MDGIVIAVISVTVIGLICAVMLAVASKIMAVKEDERFPAVRECLPGANCGACGYAGCDGYAHALIEEEGVKTNLCVPGGDTVAKKLSEVLGVEFEDVVEQVAVVKCLGDCRVTSDKMEYQGIESCAAAKLLFGGKGKCQFGCMGLGDCARICPQNAICIESGIAHVNTHLCVGCGMCVSTCPNKLITLMPDVEKVLVTCSNTDKGASTRNACSHGCIACRKCEKECPEGAIAVVDNLARIDYDKCTNCGHCAEVCVTGCIVKSDFSGIHHTVQK
ncbi:MAG: Fe-S cluster domain-containing protein [Clostridiales bacterium]|nr:Fe-S cluster domain-containing protein [Clostridiales bacterium]